MIVPPIGAIRGVETNNLLISVDSLFKSDLPRTSFSPMF